MPVFSPARIHPTSGIENMGAQWVSVTQCKIGVGSCRSDDDTADIVVPADITIAITASGVNGRDAGAEAASTWYAIWAIADSTGANAVAGLLSLSSTAPTMPTGYDLKRRVGWLRNDGSSNILQWNLSMAAGGYREVTYHDVEESVLEVLTGGAGTSYANISLATLCPPTTRYALLIVDTDGDADGEHVRVRAAGSSVAVSANRVFAGHTGGRARNSGLLKTRVSTSQAIEYENSAISNTSYIWVIGFIEAI